MSDPDYSPAFQDEYQRLWHEAAAKRDEYRALVQRAVPFVEACMFIAQGESKGPSLGWMADAAEALNRAEATGHTSRD